MTIPPDDSLLIREISQRHKKHKRNLTREEEVVLIHNYHNAINRVIEALKAIDDNPTLTEAQEKELFKVAKKMVLDVKSVNHDAKARKAMDTLVDRNLGLILDKAKKTAMKTKFLSEYDLYIEGVKGVLHALDKWDTKRRNSKGEPLKFSTYATYWIRHYIGRSVQDFDRSIRIPIHIHDDLKKLEKAYAEYCSTNFDVAAPTSAVLTAILNAPPYDLKITKEKVEELGRHKHAIESLDKNLHDDDDSATVLSHLSADYYTQPEAPSEINENKDKLNLLLRVLTPIEAKFISLRYGLTDGIERTDRQMAFLMSCKITEVPRVEALILEKLKDKGNPDEFNL